MNHWLLLISIVPTIRQYRIRQWLNVSNDYLIQCWPRTLKHYSVTRIHWVNTLMFRVTTCNDYLCHDDVIKWKLFPRYWPFVRGIHRSPVNSPHKGQWRRALMFSLFCARINGWVNNREAGDLRRHQAHCDVIVMVFATFTWLQHIITWERTYSLWNCVIHISDNGSVLHNSSAFIWSTFLCS